MDVQLGYREARVFRSQFRVSGFEGIGFRVGVFFSFRAWSFGIWAPEWCADEGRISPTGSGSPDTGEPCKKFQHVMKFTGDPLDHVDLQAQSSQLAQAWISCNLNLSFCLI